MLSKYRILELKYFCLQYSEYQERIINLNSKISPVGVFGKTKVKGEMPKDISTELAYLSSKKKAIEDAAKGCDREIGDYVFIAATRGLSFTQLKMLYGLPCERDMYYDRRKKFLILLDQYV